MKAQTTAILACVVVFAMVFASASTITYSWWSDSEEAEITVTTGNIYLDATPTVTVQGATNATVDVENSSVNGVTKSNIEVKFLAPGSSIVLTYDGSLNASIDTIYNIATSKSGPFVVDVDAYITDGTTKYAENQVMSPGDKDVKGTITFTLPDSVGNEYMGQIFSLSVIFGVYQSNIDPNEIPSDSTSKTIVADGNNVVSVSNNGTTVSITGLKSTAPNGTAKVSVLNGYVSNGYTLGQVAKFVAGLSVEFNNNGSQVGETTVAIVLDGNYADANDVLKAGYAINHVDGDSITSVTDVSAVYDENTSKTTITFKASSFSEYYLMDERAIMIGQEMYTLQGAFDYANGAGEQTCMTLVRDVNGTGAVLASGSNVVLDLDGFTYTFARDPVGSEGTETIGLQLLKGSEITIMNGTLAVDTGLEGAYFKMLIQNYCDLTLDNVIVDGRGLLGDSANYVVSNNCGDSVLTGNTTIRADAGDVAFDVYDYTSAGYSLPTVTVESFVTIDGAIEANAKVGNTYCATLGQAVSKATEGDEVTMLSDFTGDVVMASNSTTINGNGNTIKGSVNLNGKYGVSLKNITFDAAGAKAAYDGKGNGKQYANIMSGAEGNNPGKGARNLTIEGCTFTGAFANGGVSIAFCDQGRGSGQSGDITIRGCTFDTDGGYYDIYAFYFGYGELIIEDNTFSSDVLGLPIYLGRYQSSVPVVVNGNTFEIVDSLEDAVYLQAHSNSYNVSIDAEDNTFATQPVTDNS